MDKLDHIFELQKGFQDKLKRERGLEGIPMETWLQKQTLAMISELAELLEEVNFKWWKNPHELRPDCVREELSDILHFFVYQRAKWKLWILICFIYHVFRKILSVYCD